MSTINVSDLDDRMLCDLDDALMVETRRRELEPTWEMVRGLSDEEVDALHELVDTEQDTRAAKATAMHLAHELEQGEAREQSGGVDRERMFMLRVARLFKLARLNAPDPIMNHAIDMVVKVRPA